AGPQAGPRHAPSGEEFVEARHAPSRESARRAGHGPENAAGGATGKPDFARRGNLKSPGGAGDTACGRVRLETRHDHNRPDSPTADTAPAAAAAAAAAAEGSERAARGAAVAAADRPRPGA